MHFPPNRDNSRAASPARPASADSSRNPDVIARIDKGDRRHDGRAPFVTRVMVSVLSEAGLPTQSWDCVSHNLSREGLAFSSRRRVELGSRVIVETSSSIPGRNISYYGVVHQVREATPENFVVGVSFEEMPVDPALHDWLSGRPTLPDE